MSEKIETPRALAAVYFTFLCFWMNVIIQLTLTVFTVKTMVPVWLTFVIALPTIAIFGAIFGKKIINTKPPYKIKCFFLGVLLFCLSLIVFDAILLLLIKPYQFGLYVFTIKTNKYVVIYLYLLIYSFILLGSWLAILTGLAAIYLRDKMVPRFIAFHDAQTASNKDKEA